MSHIPLSKDQNTTCLLPPFPVPKPYTTARLRCLAKLCPKKPSDTVRSTPFRRLDDCHESCGHSHTLLPNYANIYIEHSDYSTYLYHHHTDCTAHFLGERLTFDLPLVGIETNPGPPKLKSRVSKPKRVPRTRRAAPPARRRARGPMRVVSLTAAPRRGRTGRRQGNTPSDERVVIKATEYLSLIQGSVQSTVALQLFINPGLGATFPKLANIANAFEWYRFKSLKFKYTSTSGTAVSSTSAALGEICMATDFDVFDSNFTSIQQAANYADAKDQKPARNFAHDCVSMKRRHNAGIGNSQFAMLKVRNITVPTGASQSEYDLGNFQVLTAGQQSSYALGHISVEYEIELFKFKQTTSPSSNLSMHASTTNHFAAATMVLYSVTPVPGSNFVSTIGNNNFTMATPGTYLVNINWTGATGIATAPNLVLGSALAQPLLWDNDTSIGLTLWSSIAASVTTVVIVVSPGSGAANTIQVTGLASMAGPCYVDMWIAPISSGIDTITLTPLQIMQNRLAKLELDIEQDSYVPLSLFDEQKSPTITNPDGRVMVSQLEDTPRNLSTHRVVKLS
jgi:hypothetical protein